MSNPALPDDRQSLEEIVGSLGRYVVPLQVDLGNLNGHAIYLEKLLHDNSLGLFEKYKTVPALVVPQCPPPTILRYVTRRDPDAEQRIIALVTQPSPEMAVEDWRSIKNRVQFEVERHRTASSLLEPFIEKYFEAVYRLGITPVDSGGAKGRQDKSPDLYLKAYRFILGKGEKIESFYKAQEAFCHADQKDQVARCDEMRETGRNLFQDLATGAAGLSALKALSGEYRPELWDGYQRDAIRRINIAGDYGDDLVAAILARILFCLEEHLRFVQRCVTPMQAADFAALRRLQVGIRLRHTTFSFSNFATWLERMPAIAEQLWNRDSYTAAAALGKATEILSAGAALLAVKALSAKEQPSLTDGNTDSANSDDSQKKDLPNWDRDRSELFFRSNVVRTFRRPGAATNVIKILDAFQEESWPQRIDDPLDGGKLHETLKSLNRGLGAIKFRADGRSEGIIWELR